MDIKVRALDENEVKSTQQVEQELLDQHEDAQKVDGKENEQPEGDTSATELDESQVLSFIKDRYGKEVNNFDELLAERESQEDIPEDIAGYLKYRQETGRTMEDYLKLNEDFEALGDDDLLKRYLLSTEDGVDEEDLDVLMEDYSFDEDLDDESDIKKKRLARKKAVAKAKEYFNEQKEKYGKPLESSTAGMSSEDKEAFEAYKQYVSESKTIEEENQRKSDWFVKKTDEVFNTEFKGFEFRIGDKSVVYSPGDAEELKKSNSSPMNFIGKFLDENGMLSDAAEYHKALSVAMNPSRFAQYFYEQGKADAVDDVSRKSKNINMDTRAVSQNARKDGLSIRAVTPPSNGNRLVIRSNKR
jgi:hypothetical protein